MIRLTSLLLGALALSSVSARPMERRTVTSLNEAAFEEAQQRDATATRALSSVEIKTSNGQCLFVDKLSGDFRANLAPIQQAPCNGSQGQLWDVITSGKHNNVPGFALIVNTLTQACMNFDNRRAAGDQVIMFSCGGRGDGSGGVQNAQLFPFNATTKTLAPKDPGNVCFVSGGARLVNANCDGSANQIFTFGSGSSSTGTATTIAAIEEASSTNSAGTCAPDVTIVSTVTVSAAAQETQANDACPAALTVTETKTVSVTVTAGAGTQVDTQVALASVASTSTSASVAVTTTAAAAAVANAGSGSDAAGILNFNPTSAVPVSRAGGTLQPSAAAEANQRDNTATRAFSNVSIRTNNGKCLFINPQAGDFRQELIPIAIKDCTGSANEKFDVITSGKHDNTPGSSLVVSTLTQGCLNFDPRRAAGDTVILFSCGGRADGQGGTTNSQTFKISGKGPFVLSPDNSNNATCLAPNSAGTLLDSFNCNGSAAQTFTIV